MLTRLGEAGADAFTIMKIAGQSSVTVSQRYVHPTPEGMERAFERLEELNAGKYQTAEAEAGRPFPPGVSGDPNGRPPVGASVAELARGEIEKRDLVATSQRARDGGA